MSARHLGSWEYDRDAELTCPSCGWVGRGADNEELYEELLDVCCPECDRMLLIVPHPTGDETRAAAAAGNLHAQAELPNVDAREERWRRADDLELKTADQLPELRGRKLRIAWDFEVRDGEHWTVLRRRRRVIWRELAYWEGYQRYQAVFEILRERYGKRLVEVRPSPRSELYLYGDKLSAPDRIDALNASLRHQ